MLAAPARGTQGLRPEDISELVRDLVARHAGTGATTSAPAEAGAPAMGAAVREASVQAEGSAHQHSAEGGGAPAQARDGDVVEGKNLELHARCLYPWVRSNSAMKSTSASMPSSGIAL